MPQVPFAEHGFGLFGPDFGVPRGGFCLSTFLVLEREEHILVGRMAAEAEPEWTRRWAPNVAYYEGERHERLFEGWRLPGTYVRTGEHPSQAVRRVLDDQLDIPGELDPGEPAVFSQASPSRRAPEAHHWDVFFLYRSEGPDVQHPPPRPWSKLEYKDSQELGDLDWVMRHGELLELL